MVKVIHDIHGTVPNICGPFLKDLLLKIWEAYEYCLNSVNFGAEIFFKWVRILTQISKFEKTKGALFSSTFKVWENKVPLFFFKFCFKVEIWPFLVVKQL